MGQVWVPADDMIAKVLSGDATAEEAAAAAAETINQGIEQLGL
jgi:maltose-binding protein MalE